MIHPQTTMAFYLCEHPTYSLTTHIDRLYLTYKWPPRPPRSPPQGGFRLYGFGKNCCTAPTIFLNCPFGSLCIYLWSRFALMSRSCESITTEFLSPTVIGT